MKSPSFTLVVGGAGYIGSHVNQSLQMAGHYTIVLDNLSRGFKQAVVKGEFIEGDLADTDLLRTIFKKFNIHTVMHFSSFIDVGESMLNPALYYSNNVLNTLNLIDAMVENGVKNLIFSSSAAVYGAPKKLPIDESHPLDPINPYGKTKWMVEEILKDYDAAYGLKSISLRYFNAAGGDPNGVIRYFKRKESNLIPIILNSLLQGGSKSVEVYGNDYPTKDGSCIRDYIHVADLAEAHILAMKKLLSGGTSSVYNLGNGEGFSVFDVIKATEEIIHEPLNIIIGPRRPGDPPSLVANSTKAAKELGWRPKFPNLRQMVKDAWNARRDLL